MRRWAHLLLGLLYLLPQVGLTLHETEASPVCASCEDRGPSVECAGDGCEDSGHHHHPHTHHHPGNCRTCSSGEWIALESSVAILTTSAAPFETVDVDPSSCAALQPGRPIRAPPATSRVTA